MASTSPKNRTDGPRKLDVLCLTHDRLVAWLKEHDIAAYRAAQIMKWLYLRQCDDFALMTDIHKDIRALLKTYFTIDRLAVKTVETSRDGSRKYLFQLSDGNYLESVLIPERNHYTLCISSQVGCAQGCRFCLTARGGFIRNLTMGEIIAQVRDVKNILNDGSPLTNIVLMGMGEPLANYKSVIRALNIITNNDYGLRFANRRVTLSTAGLVPRLADLGNDSRVNLAVSLNATDDATRDYLMPINRTFPLDQLLEACRNYNLMPHRRITFEYILIKGINDSTEDAKRLARLLHTTKAKINLIPFNEHPGSPFKRPAQADIDRFQQILLQKHYTVIVRHSKGQDISAACGQLRGKWQAK